MKYGNYPFSLEGAGIETLDPYDGKSLKYWSPEEGDVQAFILTSAGPDNDWKERIKVLSKECQFDPEEYSLLRSDGDRELEYTIWASRPR